MATTYYLPVPFRVGDQIVIHYEHHDDLETEVLGWRESDQSVIVRDGDYGEHYYCPTWLRDHAEIVPPLTDAERIGRLADHGQDWTDALCDALQRQRPTAGDVESGHRYEQDDGTAIVVCSGGGAWDYGVHRDRLDEAQALITRDREHDDGREPSDARYCWPAAEACLPGPETDWTGIPVRG